MRKLLIAVCVIAQINFCGFWSRASALSLTQLTPQQASQTDAAPSVYKVPTLRAGVVGQFEIGVRVEGTIQETFQSEQDYGTSFSADNEFKLERSTKLEVGEELNENYDETTTSRPMPRQSGFINGIFEIIYKDDPTKFVNAFADAVDYAVRPYDVKWISTYKRRNWKKDTLTIDNKTVNKQEYKESFIKKVSTKLTQTQSTGANAGYLRCGVRLYNEGDEGIWVKNPSFAIYFVHGNRISYQLERGIVRAFREDAQKDETHFVPARGSLDLQVRATGLDYIKLINNYADATNLLLRLQPPLISRKETVEFQPLSQEIEKERSRGIFVQLRSEGMQSYERIIGIPQNSSGLTVEQILKALDLSYKTSNESQNFAYSITEVEDDSNSSADSLDKLKGKDLIAWRKWLVFVTKSNGSIKGDFKGTDILKPGYGLSLVQMRAKDIQGRNYAPVVYERKNIEFNSNQETDLFDKADSFLLQPGDRIELSNIKVRGVSLDKVTCDVEPIQMSKLEMSQRFGADNDFLGVVNAYFPYKIEGQSLHKANAFFWFDLRPDRPPDLSAGEFSAFLFLALVVFPDAENNNRFFRPVMQSAQMFEKGKAGLYPVSNNLDVSKWEWEVSDEKAVSDSTLSEAKLTSRVLKNRTQTGKSQWVLKAPSFLYSPFVVLDYQERSTRDTFGYQSLPGDLGFPAMLETPLGTVSFDGSISPIFIRSRGFGWNANSGDGFFPSSLKNQVRPLPVDKFPGRNVQPLPGSSKWIKLGFDMKVIRDL